MDSKTTTFIDAQAQRTMTLRSRARDTFRIADKSERWAFHFVTLTYAPENLPEFRNSSPSADVRDSIEAFRRYIRRTLKLSPSKILSYMWVLESHKNGNPHVHIIFRYPRHLPFPRFDDAGFWPWGYTNTQTCRHAGAAVMYAVKYATKVTRSGSWGAYVRTYGFGGFGETLSRVRWWRLPVFVRESFSSSDRPVRAPGGGWVSRRTGEWLPPPEGLSVYPTSHGVMMVFRGY